MMKTSKKPVLFIAGPTASGKSTSALRLAKILDGVVINADSMQVYEDLSIVSARPSAEDCNAVPIAVRYPRGAGIGAAIPENPEILEIGKGRIVRQGNKVAILSLGARIGEAMKAADELNAKGLSTTIADARFAKPLDEGLIRKLAAEHEVLITIEEGSSGGFGAYVLHFLSDEGLVDDGLKIRTMRLPDTYIDQDKPEIMYDIAGLNAKHIVAEALKALGHNDLGEVDSTLVSA